MTTTTASPSGPPEISTGNALSLGGSAPAPRMSTDQLKQSENRLHAKTLTGLGSENDDSMVYIGNQSGLMDADKIHALPGQPMGVDFNQYAGYVTVDAMAGRALFYYFVESPNNSDTKPLVLWLHGGCSSLGYGAMAELGPFRVNSDGKTLFRNQYAWNNEANVIFLESPAGRGFSYSNTFTDYRRVGDKRTAKDSYTFLINWLERFPHYKNRDLYITGNGYAGHYAPQLADIVLSKNNITDQTPINLKGIAIGNAWIDYDTGLQGVYDYYWTHALNSDETHDGITKYCDYDNGNFTRTCLDYQNQGNAEVGHINLANIYAPLCDSSAPKHPSPGSIEDYDPCSIIYVKSYLNLPEVQKALHTINKEWLCSRVRWRDSPKTMHPAINKLIAKGIRLWLYSGDMDGWIPITSSRYAINKLKLPVETSWRAWYSKKEVGGYVIAYKGLVLATVRGAGLGVPRDQPGRALTMFSSFLQGKLPPSS